MTMRPTLLVSAAAGAAILAGCGGEDGMPIAPDRTPPEVIAVSPADGAVGVPEAAETVHVVFDEPVVIDSLATSLVLRASGATQPVDGRVSLDSTATILTLALRFPLVIGTDYALTLAAGIADAAGNARPDSLITRFTTALAFSRLGRIFSANSASFDLSVIEVVTYEPVPGSPVTLGVSPHWLDADPDGEAIYVTYTNYAPITDGGVLKVDGRSLTVVADTGPVLPVDLSGITVSPEDGLVFAVSPGSGTLYVLDSSTLEATREPFRFARVSEAPKQVAVAKHLRYLLVALDGSRRLAAFRLPGLDPVSDFPAESVPGAHTVLVDEARARAWVAGTQRYAVVDLINPERTLTFQMPYTGERDLLWSMIHDPVHDRVYFLNRYEYVSAVVASTLEAAPESPGRFYLIASDLIQDPRTGNLFILGHRNRDAPTALVNRSTLRRIAWGPRLGHAATDLEVLP